jgi:hypothetical protein
MRVRNAGLQRNVYIHKTFKAVMNENYLKTFFLETRETNCSCTYGVIHIP